jgi:hypothetical protein
MFNRWRGEKHGKKKKKTLSMILNIDFLKIKNRQNCKPIKNKKRLAWQV